jgi:hypothetical protein
VERQIALRLGLNDHLVLENRQARIADELSIGVGDPSR